ncbi:MAG: PP2C family protein-serine/threonine phosphatase [Bryobacteraceae bacterium]
MEQQRLLDAAQRIHSSRELDELLRRVLGMAVRELQALGAFLSSGTVEVGERIPVYGKVPGNFAEWNQRGWRSGYSSAPAIGSGGEILAHLVVYRKESLSLEEHDFLEGLALQVAVALRDAGHHQQLVEWERVRFDLEAARSIQRSLLPESMPPIDGYSLRFRFTPCYEVGGDYVDVIALPDGRLMLVVADVAGKGLASALISMNFRAVCRAVCWSGLGLAEMASRLNMLHWLEGTEVQHRYVTAILVCLDARAHTLEAVNAGHCPAFLCRDGEKTKISASGPPIGLLPDRRYEKESFSLPAGSQLLLYTDGLTEVFRGGVEFGEDRLMGLIASTSSVDLLDEIWDAVDVFGGEHGQSDDRTALHLQRL